MNCVRCGMYELWGLTATHDVVDGRVIKVRQYPLYCLEHAEQAAKELAGAEGRQ